MNTILITAYAINPYKGSEDGTGWNWVYQLAKTNRIIAITRENNLPHIQRYLEENEVPHRENMQFLGFDLPYYLRFWKRGEFGALPYFYLWQRSVPGFIRKQNLSYDLIHNLNFHNDWIPTFLWKLDKPVIWGPVAHHDPVPTEYIKPIYGWKAWLKDQARWKIKQIFWRLSSNFRKSVSQSDLILGINSSVQAAVGHPDHFRLMPAIGAKDLAIDLGQKKPGEYMEILSIGRFVPLKGFDLTLKAFSRFYHQLSAADRDRVRLNLVGKGPLKEWLSSLAEELGVLPAVRFIAWMPQEELASLYRQTDVFLFPSHEGAGMVIPEALSYGIPVICLDNAGPGESITADCGIAVPCETYEDTVTALANALNRLFEDPFRLREMGLAARRRFDTWFNWEEKARKVQQWYEELLQADQSQRENHSTTAQSQSASPKKFVVAHLYNNFTGSPLVLAQTLRAMQRHGHEVDLYTSKGPGFLDKAPASRWNHHWYSWSPNKYIRLLNFTVSQCWLMLRLLKYWRQDVTILANTILPFGAGLAGWLMRKRVIYHVHETEFQPPAFTKLLLSVIRLSAAKLIFVSKYLQNYHHFPGIEQEVVYNALPEEFVKKAKKNLSVSTPSEDFEVLMMCSMKKAKGIFEYIELARELPHLSFKLVISQSQDQIDRFLQGEILPANLELFPVQRDVHPFYQQADLLLSLSHPIEWPETFGMSIVEGLSYGLPVIVPPVGAPLEIIEEGKEGFHLDMRELEKIVEKVAFLATHGEEWRQLSNQALEKAGKFSVEVFGKEINRVLVE
ncbi:MAG: glycosyltransferase family 4 protein [Bacteroidota bacterium]